MSTPICETHLPNRPATARGKVRDIYDLGDKLLIVATDRISAFDWINPVGIPDKGKILYRDDAVLVGAREGSCAKPPYFGGFEGFSPKIFRRPRSSLTGAPCWCISARCFRWSS